jgi:glycosyltransferase involved in cell wall biosynthesis
VSHGNSPTPLPRTERPTIVMDARFTRLDHHDGISRYGASLMAAVAPHADVTMLIHDERQLALLPDLPWVKINSPLSPLELLVSRHVNKLDADLVFCPMQTMGSWGRKYPLVLTLHDLIYYEHPAPPSFLPALVRVLWRLYHKAYWPQRVLLNRADVVATISNTTLGLMRRHRLTKRPIRIVGNAPQGNRVPRDPAVPPEKTLTYMGSFMPYKNVETLIAGMAGLEGYTLNLLSRITPERRAELEAQVPAGAKVVFHNGVTDAEYDELLLRTTALVTLSKAEGYGLPLVEAMALGTPAVVADTEIFREVGGDAAHYVPADSPTAFAAAVRALDDGGAWAASSTASVAQAATFSWEASARELLEIAGELRR